MKPNSNVAEDLDDSDPFQETDQNIINDIPSIDCKNEDDTFEYKKESTMDEWKFGDTNEKEPNKQGTPNQGGMLFWDFKNFNSSSKEKLQYEHDVSRETVKHISEITDKSNNTPPSTDKPSIN